MESRKRINLPAAEDLTTLIQGEAINALVVGAYCFETNKKSRSSACTRLLYYDIRTRKLNNGPLLINKENFHHTTHKLIIPLMLRNKNANSNNHFILVVVEFFKKKHIMVMTAFDSMKMTEQRRQHMKEIFKQLKEHIKTMEEKKGQRISPKVVAKIDTKEKQEGIVDCGIYVMNRVRTISKTSRKRNRKWKIEPGNSEPVRMALFQEMVKKDMWDCRREPPKLLKKDCKHIKLCYLSGCKNKGEISQKSPKHGGIRVRDIKEMM